MIDARRARLLDQRHILAEHVVQCRAAIAHVQHGEAEIVNLTLVSIDDCQTAIFLETLTITAYLLCNGNKP